MAALLRWMLVLALAAHGFAQAETPPAQAESAEKKAIREIVADPVFGGEKEESGWRYVSGQAAQNAPPPAWLKGWLDFVESASKVMRVLAWIAGACLLAALIYLSYRFRHRWLGQARARAAPPNFLFGLDVRPESLPDDVVAAALQALAQGNAAATLSLLYRASLVSLIHRNQLDFHSGHTENDCLARVRAAVDAACSGYFAELLEAWKLTAYGHATLPQAELEGLCRRWAAHFAAAARPS